MYTGCFSIKENCTKRFEGYVNGYVRACNLCQGADIKGHPSVMYMYFMDGVVMCIRCSLHKPLGLFAQPAVLR